ncbi:MAG: UDP-N-acetylglucosamine--N-acetylmuramyl-(pentapeptide) pyrophosphoryl-undecaprenol N-acetylglucosamine transferase [Alphaproteobacteria bacterium]|nr:UDP-N-acetylglucosamine--N-acetylmuramyl-(pentapeptide) pyrophosphoryl-undecaprenol N-acetylglucosamine transferase [Alphaproteobacteria bacterium]
MKEHIIIAAGGTGGHVFPALCLAKALANKNYQVEFIVDKRGSKYLSNIKNNNIKINIQNINNRSRIILYISVIKNIILNVFSFIFNRPKYIIGFGGYPSFAPVFAGQILRLKNAIHEQNAVVGYANGVLSKYTNTIFTSFYNTIGIKYHNKIACTGNPTRYDDIYCNIPEYTPNNNKIFTILIFGGSQGAAIFSDIVTKTICKLSNKYKLKVYQQARQEDIDNINKLYSKCNVEYYVASFFDNINELYMIADLVISRAGASSIFEIIGFKKASILIPYSKSINGDQIANATYLGQKEAAIVFSDTIVTIDILYNKIEHFINNQQELQIMSRNLSKMNLTNNTQNLLDLIDNILKSM